MIEPTSNSSQRHWVIQPMRGEGDYFGPNSGLRPPGTWRYQVGLSGLTALSNVRSQGQSGKHILPLSFSGFDPSRKWLFSPSSPSGQLIAALRNVFRSGSFAPDRNLNAVEIGGPFRLGLEGCIVDRSQDIGWQSIRQDIAPFAVTWTHIPSRSVTL